MSQVKIVVANDSDRGRAEITVLVDGQLLFNECAGGGEPEDNTYYRDWRWVVPALQKLSNALGGDVSITEEES